MKTMKKTIGILLVLVMVLGAFAIIPASAATEYDLWVNGERITSDHLTVKGTSVDGKDGGAAVFDPKTNTLTLNSVTLTECSDKDFEYAAILCRNMDLTVVVKGRCVISPEYADGIVFKGYVYDPNVGARPVNLTIKSDGKPDSELIIAPYGDKYSCGIVNYEDQVTVDGARLTIDSPSSGIYSEGGQVTIQNKAVVNSKSQNDSGLDTYGGSVLIKNSDVTFEGETDLALQLNDDKNNGNTSSLTVEGGAVTVVGRLGMYGGNTGKAHVTVTSGVLDVTGRQASMIAGEGTALILLDEKNFTLGKNIKVVEGGYKENHIRFSSEKPAPSVLLGDVDSDNDITILDATLIQRKLAGFAVEKYNEKAADTDADKEVTIIDATYIQRYLAGLSAPSGIGKKA